MAFLVGLPELALLGGVVAVATALGHIVVVALGISFSLFPGGGPAAVSGILQGQYAPFLPYAIGSFFVLIAGLVYVKARVRFVGADEMLYVELLTELKIYKGPATVVMPILLKNWKQKRALTLTKTEYSVVKNNLTGVMIT